MLLFITREKNPFLCTYVCLYYSSFSTIDYLALESESFFYVVRTKIDKRKNPLDCVLKGKIPLAIFNFF